MRIIYKYKIELDDEQRIVTHGEPNIIAVGKQYGDYFLWAEVNPDATLEEHTILVRGTGHPFTGEEGRYLGTIHDVGSQTHFVWHIYEGIQG